MTLINEPPLMATKNSSWFFNALFCSSMTNWPKAEANALVSGYSWITVIIKAKRFVGFLVLAFPFPFPSFSLYPSIAIAVCSFRRMRYNMANFFSRHYI